MKKTPLNDEDEFDDWFSRCEHCTHYNVPTNDLPCSECNELNPWSTINHYNPYQ